MPRVSAANLRRLQDHPQVKAASEALHEAAEAARAAYLAYQDADRLRDQRADDLHEVAARVLAEQNREG